MSDRANDFTGRIPHFYDHGLGPVFSVDFADDIARRAAASAPMCLLELAAGTGIVTRRLRSAECRLVDPSLEAEELHHFLQSKIHPDVGLELLSNQLGGFDLSEYDLDGPLPDIPERQFALSGLGNTRNISRGAREEGLTIRQIYQRFAAARGQRTLIGSPSDIADDMEEWFRGYGVDGFLFHPSHLPVGLDDFVALVIPELQSRGLFRAEYEGTTLRENMGLERPKSRYLSP